MLEITGFTKRYGDRLAVDDLYLKVPRGELFGLIGPAAAGKSTTIRFLATLVRATAGDGIVNGHRISHDPLAVRRSMGYLPDDFGVYQGMKVWEYLDFFAVAYQVPRQRRKQAVAEVIERLDLGAKRDACASGLCGGLKQRLGLAKTLVHDPPLLILDEPAKGLDPGARSELAALFEELRGRGKTIVVTGHVLGALADCCTAIGIIDRGKLLMHGPRQQVYRQIHGNRIVRIRFVENLEAGLSVIRSTPQVRHAEIDPPLVTVELAGGEQVLGGLLERLVAAGARVSSFAEKEPTLEEVVARVAKGSTA